MRLAPISFSHDNPAASSDRDGRDFFWIRRGSVEYVDEPNIFPARFTGVYSGAEGARRVEARNRFKYDIEVQYGPDAEPDGLGGWQRPVPSPSDVISDFGERLRERADHAVPRRDQDGHDVYPDYTERDKSTDLQMLFFVTSAQSGLQRTPASLEPIPPGQFIKGSRAGMCAQCAGEALAAHPGSKLVMAPGENMITTHWAVELPNGQIIDASLRDNLAFYGAKVGDIGVSERVFSKDRWLRLVSRFPHLSY